MTSQEVLSLAGSIIATLGGGSVVVFALSGWLGKIWADRLMKASIFSHEKELEALRDKYTNDLEKLKTQLKKSEFMFEKEFVAASKLIEYHEEIIPLSQGPYMHMDDVFESIALQGEPVESLEVAEEIYNRIRSARDAMRERVWQQSST